MREYGTGSNYQQAAQAVTAALQYLAGGDIGGAVAGASAPYVATLIKQQTGDNDTARIMAQAVLGAVVANAQGNSGVAGAAGAATGELIAKQLYPNRPHDQLTEKERQIVSALSTLAAGMTGGLVGGNSSGVVAGAAAGKNAVENNDLFPANAQQMATGSEYYIAKKIQEALAGATPEQVREAAISVDKNSGYAGPDIIGNYFKAWGLVVSAAPFALEGGVAVGVSGALAGGAVGGGANASYQLTKDPTQFSFTDLTVAALVGVFTQGKSIPASVATNMGGAYIGSQVKGADPLPAVLGAGVGAVGGSAAGKALGNGIASEVSSTVREHAETIGGAISSEIVSDAVSSGASKK
ncbi:VENN motif pre-toxin domain-containing protein [Enterobacterales bacterium AE_CKDN230030158-1A_HGKHYDSX7]